MHVFRRGGKALALVLILALVVSGAMRVESRGTLPATSRLTASTESAFAVIEAGDVAGLADAIAQANARGSGARPFYIYLKAGAFELAEAALPEISGNVAVLGQGSILRQYHVGVNGASLSVASTGRLELHHVAFESASGIGRAIVSVGRVSINDSRFGVAGGEGGGVYNVGLLQVIRSRFDGLKYFSTNDPGAAIFNGGTATVTCAAFAEGLAERGGAIFNSTTGNLRVADSAFTGNQANGGGAIFNDGDAPVSAEGNFWGGSKPRVEGKYRGTDTVSDKVAAEATAAADPTTGAGCAAVAAVPVPTPGSEPVVLKAPVMPPPSVSDLMTKFGAARVIVGLDVNFTPEGALSEAAVEAQQSAIQAAQSGLVASLAGLNYTETARFQYIPFMGLEVDAAALAALQSSPFVISIEEDELARTDLTDSTALIGASASWTVGYEGNGWTVAILDTGVRKTHEFIGTAKVVSEACYSTTDGTYPSTSLCPGGVAESTAANSGLDCATSITGCGHGTHVGGIAGGSRAAIPRYGVARNANLIAIQVFTRFAASYCLSIGYSTTDCALSFTTDQVKGLERVYALRDTYKIASANMSLGGGQYTSYCDANNAARKTAIDNLRSVNIATVIATGNTGYTSAMGSPGCISTAVSVGATTKSDVVASYSNAASFMSMWAPGSSITSSTGASDTTYESWNGTSMATPHVAGAWALLRSARMDATVTQILAAITSTGPSITDTRTGGSVTKPRLNVKGAINSLAAKTDAPGIYQSGNWWMRRDAGVSGDWNYLWQGSASWTPVVGDWDGDGQDSIGLYSNGQWWLQSDYGQADPVIGVYYGGTGWLPVVGDWNGDGKDSVGIYNNGQWYFRVDLSQAYADYASYWQGSSTTIPVVGDWDGDGRDAPGLFLDGNWWLKSDLFQADSEQYAYYGGSGWTPVVGDWNGDGKDAPGIFQNGNWWLRNDLGTSGDYAYNWYGATGWTPVVGNWNGMTTVP